MKEKPEQPERDKMKGALGLFSQQNIFGLTYGSYFGGSCAISIVRHDGDNDLCAISGGNGYPEDTEFFIPRGSVETISETLEKIKLWNNKYDCPGVILDGFGWEVMFTEDGKEIRKSGYMAYPENYNEVMRELLFFIEGQKKSAFQGRKLYLPLDPFEREGYFVPVGEKTVKEEHYRKTRFRTEMKLWSPNEQMYEEKRG